MAKKMSKAVKKSNNSGLLASLVALVLSVASVLCMLMPFYKWQIGTESYYKYTVPGFTLAWGGDVTYNSKLGSLEGTGTGNIGTQNGWIIAIFCLFVIGAVMMLAYLVLSFTSLASKSYLKFLPLIAFLALVTAGVLCFITVTFVKDQVSNSNLNSIIEKLMNNGTKVDGLGYGAYLSGICGILGGLASAGALLKK